MLPRLMIIGVLASVVATACGSERKLAGAERTARVVISVPKAGPGSALADDIVDAARIELDRRGGRAGGAKVVLQVVSESGPDGSRADPEQVARQAAAAVADRDTVGWLGGFDSNTTAVALPLLNSGGVTAVSALAAATPLTQRDLDFPGAPAKYYPRADAYGRNFARLTADDTRIARLAVRSLSGRGVRSIYAIDSGDTDGVAFSSALSRFAPASGIRFAGRQSVIGEQADWPAVVEEARASGADAIAWGSAAGLGEKELWRAVSDGGGGQLMVAGPAVPQDVLAGLPAVKGGTTSFSGLVPWTESQAGMARFIERFRRQTGRLPLPGTANASAAMDLLLDSIGSGSRTAGPSQTGDDLRAATAKALHSILAVRTDFGRVELTPVGNALNAPVIEWAVAPGAVKPVGRL